MILVDPCPNPLKMLWEVIKTIIKNRKDNGKAKFQLNHEGDYILETTTYANNDTLALMMYPDGCPDNFIVISVNLGNDMVQDKEHCFIDSNNCPFAEELLLDLGIAEITFISQRSGFCNYNLLRIDLSKFND